MLGNGIIIMIATCSMGMKSLLIIFSLLSLVACQQNLKPTSGLFDVPLERVSALPVDGLWVSNQAQPEINQKKGYFYIAPLDVSQVKKKHPLLSHLAIHQWHDAMVRAMYQELQSQESKGLQWQLTDQPQKADVIIEMALTKITPQHWLINLMGQIGSFFVPVPGTGTIVGYMTKGNISMELAIRNNHNKELLLAFKDSNRKATRFYSANAYNRGGAACENLHFWAVEFAKLIVPMKFDEHKKLVLRQELKKRSKTRILRDYLKTQF